MKSIPATNRSCFSCGRIFPSWGERKCPLCRHPKQRESYPRVGGRLSFREQQIAELIAQAKCDKEIGAQIGITPGTVKIYITHMLTKLTGTIAERNRVAVAVWWVLGGREEYQVQTSANPEAA